MRTRKSIGFGFGSVFALALVLVGLAASASGQTASLSGSVQGGLSAVSGAVVTLYMAGTEYGANATSLGQATTDSGGNFTIGYAPPATPAVLYLIALGGNAGAGINTAIGLMGVAGRSDALPAAVTINELTTIAAESALAQFIDAIGQIIGSPASNATGLANAANQTQADLVDISSGALANFWTTYGATEAGCHAVPPSPNCYGLERLDTLGNILAACVETSGRSSSACSRLLKQTASSTTTLGAAHFLATHPFANGTLVTLQSASAPFTPALSVVPGAWQITLDFTTPSAVLAGPAGLAIDAAGNVWVANHNRSTVTELTPSGGLAGNFDNTNTRGANFNGPEGVAVDTAGNVWVTNIASKGGSGSVTELTSSGSLVGNFAPSGAFNSPHGLAIDANDNIWVTNFNGNSVTELTSSGGLASNFNNTNTRGANFNVPFYVAIDEAGNIWSQNYYGDSLTELTSSGGLVGNFAPSGANFVGPEGLAIDANDNIWVTNFNGNSVTELTSNGGLAGNFNNTTRAKFNYPDGVAIDTGGDVWVTNYSGNSMTELTSSGSLVGNFAPIGVTPNELEGVAIDAAGNVWVANFLNSVKELIGAARPVLTPLVACLKQTPPHAVCLP